MNGVSPDADEARFGQAIRLCIGVVAGLWILHGLNVALGLELVQYGIFPRTTAGLRGIALAPLIHGSSKHLIANSVPLVILGTALLYGYPRAARVVLPVLYIGTGLGVWLWARPAFHIGASGLTFGMMFFVFVIGALRWDRRAIALAMIVFFLYGGMVWGIFPGEPQVSFESHAMGAALGITLAVLLRHLDPAPPPKRYDWEGVEDDEPWPPER